MENLITTERTQTHDLIEKSVKESKLPKNKSHQKVLVVDDDIGSQPIWNYIVQRVDETIELSWATSAMEADRMIQLHDENQQPFDIIITDIFLSGSITGIDFWHGFNGHSPTKFILMSSAEPLKIQKYFGDKEYPIYIQKPVDIHETIETIFELLHRQ